MKKPNPGQSGGGKSNGLVNETARLPSKLLSLALGEV